MRLPRAGYGRSADPFRIRTFRTVQPALEPGPKSLWNKHLRMAAQPAAAAAPREG